MGEIKITLVPSASMHTLRVPVEYILEDSDLSQEEWDAMGNDQKKEVITEWISDHPIQSGLHFYVENYTEIDER